MAEGRGEVLVPPAGIRSQIWYPGADNKKVDYTYDADQRMKRVTPNWVGGQYTEYTYDDASRLLQAALPTGTGLTTAFGYDTANRLTGVTNANGGGTLSSFTYVLNSDGTRKQVTDQSSMTTQYEYDALYRLKKVTYPSPASIATYAYDAVGNRTSMQVDANPPTAGTYDAADQQTTLAGVANTFDKNGNLVNIGGTPTSNDTFLYDYENRLIRIGGCLGDVGGDGNVSILDISAIAAHFSAVEGNPANGGYDFSLDLDLDGAIAITDMSKAAAVFGRVCANTGPNTGEGINTYNGDGLRIRARTMTTPKANDDSVWDMGAGLPQVLQETHTPDGGAPGATTTTYVYGLGLISATDSLTAATSYYLTDGLGSTTQLTNSSGAVTASFNYDAFGAPKAVAASSNDFRFTGQQDDHDVSRGLYYLRARYYDPALGRFLSRDPAMAGHPYAYGESDPVNSMDPSGLDSESHGPIAVPLPAAGSIKTRDECMAKWIDCANRIVPEERDKRANDSDPFYRTEDAYKPVCQAAYEACLREMQFGNPNPYFESEESLRRQMRDLRSSTGGYRLPWTGSGGYLNAPQPECGP